MVEKFWPFKIIGTAPDKALSVGLTDEIAGLGLYCLLLSYKLSVSVLLQYDIIHPKASNKIQHFFIIKLLDWFLSEF